MLPCVLWDFQQHSWCLPRTYNNLSCDICKYLNILWGHVSQNEKSKYRYINIDIDILFYINLFILIGGLNQIYDFLNIYYSAPFYLVYFLLYTFCILLGIYIYDCSVFMKFFIYFDEWYTLSFIIFPFSYLFVCVCEHVCACV